MKVISAALVTAALLVVQPSAAQVPPPPERTISVTGEGTVEAKPDLATITLGVVTQAAAARDALLANSADMTRITAALKAAGIEGRDLQTSGFSVEPVYSQPPANYDPAQPFEPRIVGYRVGNNLAVRVRDLARTGEILDQAVTLGANSVGGPVFDVAEPAATQDEARREAVADALRKGKLYAVAAGIQLGSVARIDEAGGGFPQPMPMMAAAAKREAFDSSVPVESGVLTYRAQVNVQWRIAD